MERVTENSKTRSASSIFAGVLGQWTRKVADIIGLYTLGKIFKIRVDV
jgi:C-terminal processing protease CtpA/Prc